MAVSITIVIFKLSPQVLKDSIIPILCHSSVQTPFRFCQH